MVGISGRSKACHTCLRRRKACDLQHPACKQCQRLDLECAWYKPQVVFVNTTVRTALPDRHTLSVTHERHPRKPTPAYQLGDSIRLSAVQNYFLDLFLDLYLPKGRAITSKLPVSSTVSWIMISRAAAGSKHDFIKLAMIASSLCMLGVQQEDKVALGEGRELYGRAMLQLAEGLRHLNDRSRLSLIVQARLLGLFEIFSCQQGFAQGWTDHNSGERCLVLGGDPHMYSKGIAHQVFVDGRLHLITSSVFGRKASVFAEQEWKSVPWQEVAKTPKDKLLDVYVEIPGLLETFDKLRRAYREDARAALAQHLIYRCWIIKDELRSWYITTGSNIEFPIGNLIADGVETASLEQLASAQLLVLYWCCLLHYSQLCEEVSRLEQPEIQARIPAADDTQFTLGKVLEVIAMFLRPCSGWFGINVAAFPMVVILNYIRGDRSIGVTCKERHVLYTLLQMPRGKALSAFIESLPLLVM